MEFKNRAEQTFKSLKVSWEKKIMELTFTKKFDFEEEEFQVKKSPFREVVSFIGGNLKFLIIPGSRIEELEKREFEYEKTISKRKFIKRLKSPLTILGICIIFFIVTIAVFPDWLSTYTFVEASEKIYIGRFAAPSTAHPLGQTELGRDVLAKIIYGARSSLTIALPSIALSVVTGTALGITAAFYGGWIDSIIMRIMDTMLAFPGLILAMVFIAVWGQKMEYIMFAYGIIGIPFYSRLIRGNVLQARELPYIQAAKVSGAGNGRIMFRHILPNIIQPVIISVTFNIGGIILNLAGLSFLGFHDPRMIEWGDDINAARGNLVNAPWASLWPGFMIAITVLGFMLLGDGLRDALDPRLKNL